MGTDYFTALDLLHGIIRRACRDNAEVDLAECAAAMTMLGVLGRVDYLAEDDQRRYDDLLARMRPLNAASELNTLLRQRPARWS